MNILVDVEIKISDFKYRIGINPTHVILGKDQINRLKDEVSMYLKFKSDSVYDQICGLILLKSPLNDCLLVA